MSSTPNKKPTRLTTNNKGSCSVFGIKAAVIIVGFVLLIAVLILFYLSTWSIITKHRYAIIAAAYFYTIATYLLMISTFITILAIIAMFVTGWMEHEKGMKLTICVLMLTFVCEISAGLLEFGCTIHLEERLSKNLLNTIANKYIFDKSKTRIFDEMQKKFRCCGSKSFKDWQLNSNFNLSMASAVPDSCCKSYEPQCAQKPFGKHPSNIFYKGCSSALYQNYHTHLITLGCVTIGVSFLQVFTIILLIWLLKRVQKLIKLKASNLPVNKFRRLSNEITYYPIQSSVK